MPISCLAASRAVAAMELAVLVRLGGALQCVFWGGSDSKNQDDNGRSFLGMALFGGSEMIIFPKHW